MIEAIIALTIVNLATLGYIFWLTHKQTQSQDKLINSLVAKTSQDFTNFELSDKMKTIPQIEEVEEKPLQTAVEDLTDEEFDEHIINQQ